MKSIELNAEARQAWLRQEQQPRIAQQHPQSDFEKSLAWRGVFVAAFIVVVINIPLSPPAPQVHSTTRSTV